MKTRKFQAEVLASVVLFLLLVGLVVGVLVIRAVPPATTVRDCSTDMDCQEMHGEMYGSEPY